MPILLPRKAFVADVNERIGWLAENRTEEQLDSFLAGLEWVRKRIELSPAAGPVVRQDAQHVLRLRLFPSPLPYLVYYGHANGEPITEVFLVRLFGSGQRRSKFTMSEWPW